MTPEEFDRDFEPRLRQVARDATRLAGSERVLLGLLGCLCNFATEFGMAPAALCELLRKAADEIEEHAAAIGPGERH